MKRNQFTIIMFAAIMVVLSTSSCKKEKLSSLSLKPSTQPVEKVYSDGIRSLQQITASKEAEIAYYRIWGGTAGQMAPTYWPTAADPGIGTLVFGACTGFQAYAYKDATNTMIVLESTYGVTPIYMSDANSFFNYAIEEIEVNPTTKEIFALARVGTAMRLFSIDPYSGISTPITINGSANIFNNASGNGYKSGSIAFVPNPVTTTALNSYDLVYTNESTVYTSLGLVSWHFRFSTATNLQSLLPADPNGHRTYSTATSGIPGAQTGKINTTYGSGKLYFARDGGNLYSLNMATSNSPATLELTSAQINNKNDFGFWKAF